MRSAFIELGWDEKEECFTARNSAKQVGYILYMSRNYLAMVKTLPNFTYDLKYPTPSEPLFLYWTPEAWDWPRRENAKYSERLAFYLAQELDRE